MKTSSCKGKGRRLQNYVAESLNAKFVNDANAVGGFRPAIMGESGKDIKTAFHFPWAIECKNQESWSIPQWWQQTKANTKEEEKPLLVIKKNRHEELVVMRFKDWLELI